MKPTRTLLAAMILLGAAACTPALASTGGGGCDTGPYAELTRSHDKQCVVPDDPTAIDATCNGPGGITIPGTDDDGIIYRIDGGHVPAGFIAVPPGDYTVTASPGQNYRFPKHYDATWTLTVGPGVCETTTSSSTVPETTTTAPATTTTSVATTTTVAPLGPGPVAPPPAPPAAPIVAVPRTTG